MTRIRVGTFFDDLSGHIRNPNSVIITDENVDRIYKDKFPDVPVIVLRPGEANKTLDTVSAIYDRFMEFGVDRGTLIAGIGGGVVCDITGFAASTFLRGLKFGFFPTTLLAQADAAIGGKNGVNYRGLKNHVGTIVQPDFVFSDPSVLATLDEEEFRNGIAEIIKHGLIRDRKLIDFLENEKQLILSRDRKSLVYLIEKSIEVKMRIVRKDEKEIGERRHLNFGHTFGHIIEELHRVSHGRAVAAGMSLEAEFSASRKMITTGELEKVKQLILNYDFRNDYMCDPEKFKALLYNDKKRDLKHLWFVFLETPGRSVVERIHLKQIEEFIDDMCEPGKNIP